MEVSAELDRGCSRKQPERISQFSQSAIELRSFRPFAAADESEADNCEHFTIRGYVAEVRKRDAKKCWPFVMPNHHKSDEEANSLPPLTVRKFKRWDCLECQHKAIASVEVASGEVEVRGKCDSASFLGDDSVASQPSGSQQLLEGNFEERLDEAKSSHYVNNECHKSLFCSPRGMGSVLKEGSQVCRCCHNNSKQGHDRCSGFLSVLTEGEACHQCKRAERKKHVGTGLIGENAPVQMLYANLKVNGVLSDEQAKSVSNDGEEFGCVHGKELSKSPKKTHVSAPRKYVEPLENNASGDLQTATSAHSCNPRSLHMDKSNNRASDVNVCPSDNLGRGQNCADQLCSSHTQHKKARKVRFLNDIIRSEELRMSQENYISEAETEKTGNDSDIRVDASTGKDQELDHRSSPAEKIFTKACKRRKINDSSESEEEAPTLMHWLRKVSKKSITPQDDAKRKRITGALDDIYKTTKNASQGKGTILNSKDFRIREEGQAESDMKQNNVQQAQDAKPCPSSEPDSVIEKGIMVPAEVRPKKNQPKSTGVIEKRPHHNEKAICSKKNKACQYQNGESLQMHHLRDSSSKHEHEYAGDFQRHEIGMKKKKVIANFEQESLDEFPMDIVELLAKKQHERRLTAAAAATEDLHTVSEMVENRKNGDHCILLDFSKDIGSKVSDAVDNESYPQNYTTNNTGNVAFWNACRRSVDCNTKPYHAITNAELYHHINLNQQQPIDALRGFGMLPGHYNYPAYGSRNRVEMWASQSCHNAKRKSDWDAFRNTQDELPVLINGTSYATTQKVNSDFDRANHECNHVCMHSHDPYFQKNLNTVPCKAQNWRLMNSTGTSVLHRKENVETSMLKQTFAAPASFLETGNECSSTMRGSSDLYTNETVSAMHLLRLMDRTACSGGPVYASNDINSTVAKRDQGQHRGNACKPLRPLPRFGVLGPLLQKEITDHSNKCGTPFGFKGRCFKELTPVKKLGGSQVEVSQSASHIKVPNSQAFASGCESSKHIVSQPLERKSNIEICTINRNPADFVMVNEDCEFMRGNENHNPRVVPLSEGPQNRKHLGGQRRQKVMKLTALKGLMRS